MAYIHKYINLQGHDTTAANMAWTILMLSLNENKVHQVVCNIVVVSYNMEKIMT